jgi:hypothetical protein
VCGRSNCAITSQDTTVRPLVGFAGLENGELLKQAEAAKFDVLLTVDRGFEYQQNLADRQIAVIVFCGKSVLFEDLLPLMTTCLDDLKTIRPGEVIRIGD